jgi:S1-C subfamily serine protease
LRRYFGELPQREVLRHSLVSGFLITKDGYIVINLHLIENATDIKVALSDREGSMPSSSAGMRRRTWH